MEFHQADQLSQEALHDALRALEGAREALSPLEATQYAVHATQCATLAREAADYLARWGAPADLTGEAQSRQARAEEAAQDANRIAADLRLAAREVLY